MADPKKNPLLGAFKDPTPGTPSPEKPGEDKKPIEPPKEAEAPTTPIKPAEGEKKATEGDTPAAPLSDKDDELPADFHLDVVSKDNPGSVTLLPLSSIDDFEGHPFPVLDDKDMTDLVASIKQVGILEPTTQAKAFAMKRKAGRRTNAEKAALAAEGKKPMRSDEELAQQAGMSRAKVQRIVSVNNLAEPLKKMVDKKEMPLDTAEQVSHLKPDEQKQLADAIEKEGGKIPSKTEAVKLKEESKGGNVL